MHVTVKCSLEKGCVQMLSTDKGNCLNEVNTQIKLQILPEVIANEKTSPQTNWLPSVVLTSLIKGRSRSQVSKDYGRQHVSAGTSAGVFCRKSGYSDPKAVPGSSPIKSLQTRWADRLQPGQGNAVCARMLFASICVFTSDWLTDWLTDWLIGYLI